MRLLTKKPRTKAKAPFEDPVINVRLHAFLDSLTQLSLEYGIAIEGDNACLYALGERVVHGPDGRLQLERTFIADGLGFNDRTPRYYCCPHAITK